MYVGDAQNARGCFLVGTALTEATTDADVRAALHDAFTGLDALFEGRIARAVEEGDLPADSDPADLARYIATIIQGMAVQAAGGASREELQRVAEMALRTWPE